MAANTDNSKADTIGVKRREEKRREEKRKQVCKSDHMCFIWSKNKETVLTKKRKNYKD